MVLQQERPYGALLLSCAAQNSVAGLEMMVVPPVMVVTPITVVVMAPPSMVVAPAAMVVMVIVAARTPVVMIPVMVMAPMLHIMHQGPFGLFYQSAAAGQRRRLRGTEL